MGKDKRTQLIDDITLVIMFILTPPVFLYVGIVMIYAFIPTVKMIFVAMCCFSTLVGSLFALTMELSPILVIFVIPIGIALMQSGSGNNKRR